MWPEKYYCAGGANARPKLDKVRILALMHAVLRVVLAVLLVLSLANFAVPSHAQDPLEVDIEITSVSQPVIDVSKPDQVITISGTLTNTSDQELRWVGAHIWRSEDPIETPEELAAVLASPATQPVGARLIDEPKGNVQVLATEDGIQPGESREFSVEATLRDLGFTRDHAVYLAGVHILATPNSGGRHTIARARTLITATTASMQRNLVVRLSRKPTLVGQSSFTSDALPRELPQLLELTETALEAKATVLLDPMLYHEIEVLAGSHTVAGTPAEALPEAGSWLAAVDDLNRQNLLRRLPWGDPFLPRPMTQTSLPDLISWSNRHVPAALTEAPLTADLRAWATPQLVQEIAGTNVTGVMAANAGSGMIDDLPVYAVRSFTAPGIGPTHSDTELQTRARRLAEQLLASRPPLYEVSNLAQLQQAQADPMSKSSQDWPTVQDPATFSEAPKVPVWSAMDNSVAVLSDEAAFLADLTGDEVTEWERFNEAATSARSWSFTDQADALTRLQEAWGERRKPSLVTISAAEQFVMGDRTNEFPVTITNGMDVAIKVRLDFVSDVPQRIRVPTTDLVTIPAGENLTVGIRPQATGNGVVEVRGQLRTSEGRAFGKEIPIQITATDLGRVGWIIIIISGAVVLGGTALRIRAVRAEKAKESSERTS